MRGFHQYVSTPSRDAPHRTAALSIRQKRRKKLDNIRARGSGTPAELQVRKSRRLAGEIAARCGA